MVYFVNSDYNDKFNKISESDKYLLEVKEYEVYDRFGHRDSYSLVDKNQDLREVFDDNKKMMVQKDGKIIYDGEFKNNITDIIKENGRYYFHVYTKQKKIFISIWIF